MKRALLLALALLSGCADDKLHVYVDYIQDGVDEEVLEEQKALIEDAAGWLGHGVVFDDHGAGSITIVMVQELDGASGAKNLGGLGMDTSGGCWPWVVTEPRVHIIAHEIGHALGLGHNSDPGRLMHPTAPTLDIAEVNQREQETIDKSVRRLARCRMRRK